MEEDEYIDNSGEDPSIMPYNEVRALVNRYVGAVKTFDQMAKIKESLEYTLTPLGVKEITFEVGWNNKITSREEFSKDIQKKSWNHIFSKMNMNKYVTSGVRDNINKFVETQSKYPFTEKNVYKMFEIIVGTRQNTYNMALEEVVDNFTKHTHKNRFGVEGWKTNSGHMLNKKIIVEGVVADWCGSLSVSHGRQIDRIYDLNKVLCNITATNYDSIGTLRDLFGKEGIKTNVWYNWGFFEIKVFKKGTAHLKFIDDNVWYLLNKAYGELKGFTLSDSYSKK